MNTYVLWLQEIDRSRWQEAGGKAANLGELRRIKGIVTPEGFCVTTRAYQETIEGDSQLGRLLDELARYQATEREKISNISAEIRMAIARLPISAQITEEIAAHLANLGEQHAFAVRSSATAEDLPAASFAGQQDSYLNIVGADAILRHISQCWASLFSERAVIYRMRNGFDHRKVELAVVVQRMVFAQAAGVLFTADPVTANRKVLSIGAGFGLGEALVAGLVNADTYTVRDGKVMDKQIAAKTPALYAAEGGGIRQHKIAAERQTGQVLNDEQILQLARIGRQIEGHFGSPQDIEWCLDGDTFAVVQSRPITTLFPVPAINDAENHLYLSVGHQQMMTDAMKPLGISVWQLTAGRPMYPAGGRLFVDVAQDLASPARRNVLVNVLGSSDPLIKDALTTILKRDDFIKPLPEDAQSPSPAERPQGPPPPNYQTLNAYDPAIVAELIQSAEAAVTALTEAISDKSGPELLDFILDDIRQLRARLSDPQSFGVIMTAMNASSWINQNVAIWLGEKGVADGLSQAAPNNITSQMGLALLDVADALRPYPQAVAYLDHPSAATFADDLTQLGGKQAWEAVDAFLTRYGMRCTGEIDITRPRWRENPAMLAPALLGNIKNFAPGESRRRLERGQEEARQKETELLARLRQLPDGEQKAAETKRMIDLVRALIGYREYPKYHIVSRYFIYKQALLREAQRLVRAGVLEQAEAIDYLSLEELREAVRANYVDARIVSDRKAAYGLYEKLTPPRVMTSEGEIISGAYQRANLPHEALIGLPVSAGVVEGRARVILTMADAELEAGDVLVTRFTDPSWTPLFVAIKGLVTEVGGLMTHGAVIAREYGLPAVTGVENATSLIKDGQMIRVDGTDGYITVL